MSKEETNKIIKVLLENKWEDIKTLNLYKVGIILRDLQSQLDIANKKLRDGIEFVNNIISETDGCDDCCESEKHLLASEMLSIIGGE